MNDLSVKLLKIKTLLPFMLLWKKRQQKDVIRLVPQNILMKMLQKQTDFTF